MKRLLHTLIIIGLITSCNNSTKKQSTDNNQIQKTTHNSELDKGKESYLEIKKHFNQGYYVDLNRMISQFYEYNKESFFLDSVKLIDKKYSANLNKLKRMRDSLSQLPLLDYVNGLNLPRLDSITSKNFKIIEHSYLMDFNDFDKNLFKTDWEINWYLSKQLSDSLICVTACHFRNCENSVVLYSLDSNNIIIDKKELYDNGCYAEPAPDFRYEKYIVNEQNRFNASYFHGDTAFTRISRTYFTLKDTTTYKVLTEIGDEYNVTYRIDSLGKFNVVEDNSFKKEYVEPLYNVPI
jgi:hypothetical protein